MTGKKKPSAFIYLFLPHCAPQGLEVSYKNIYSMIKKIKKELMRKQVRMGNNINSQVGLLPKSISNWQRHSQDMPSSTLCRGDGQ